MRIIKFRGKEFDSNEWLFGSIITSNGIDFEISDWNDICYSRYEVVPETVGQYTGLKDINGTEIYEGDILLMDNTSDDELYNEVGFKDGCFGYMTETGEFLPFCDNKVTEEVVGNIHDNPELLNNH